MNDRDESPLKFTVITPTYDQAGYLAACLDSVAAQTHRNLEHLVYDAGNDAETPEIVARRNDPRIVYRRESDSGPAEAINKGFAAASGDIVCWLNSDDAFFDAQTLATVARKFAQHPGIHVITGNGYHISEDGRLLEPIVPQSTRRVSFEGLKHTDTFLQPATFWRRNDLRLDEALQFAFDWKLFLTMYRSGLSVLYLPEYLALYRRHEGSRSLQDSAARKREVCEVLKFAGASGAQLLWAWLIYSLYATSEAIRFPPLKSVARAMNLAMARLTGNRIVSA